ncbi:MAG: hypothetical protein JXQ30_04815 [Spirochaetes bacterium]|nr:hypothetical protein [Spirochaetota bacterium]
MKRIAVYLLLFSFLFFFTLHMHAAGKRSFSGAAFAEKEDWYTSSEEFLPVVDHEESEGESIDETWLENNGYITGAKIKGIKIRKDEDRMLFVISPPDAYGIEKKDLFFEVFSVAFPPRIILRLYGVYNEDRTYRFLKNLEILGVISNPFTPSWITEYVIFFEDWVRGSGVYEMEKKELVLGYEFTPPLFSQGYGVRIADTKIDPLPQVIEVKKKLDQFGLLSYLLVAQDRETVVLESPFYETKEEAVSYIESLDRFGYRGKLAIRRYTEFPVTNRFDVVSEVVITGEDDINLRNMVEKEWRPKRVYTLSYQAIHTITMGYFSPRIKADDELVAEYYFNLSDIYRHYPTEDDAVKKQAHLVALKILEIIYFFYPDSRRADDALWGIANLIQNGFGSDTLTEEDCYRALRDRYPGSPFAKEAATRIAAMEAEKKGKR